MELKEKIQKQFEKNPHLKVLFLFDAEREMIDSIEHLDLKNIKVVKYNNDPFNLKVKLNNEWASEKIFLYIPLSPPSKQEEYKKFPLMDVLVANKELRLGDVSEFLEQYHLSIDKQSLVTQYMQVLKYN